MKPWCGSGCFDEALVDEASACLLMTSIPSVLMGDPIDLSSCLLAHRASPAAYLVCRRVASAFSTFVEPQVRV